MEKEPGQETQIPDLQRANSWWSVFRVHHGREILALATPTILTMLSQTLMWTVDTALLGRVNSVSLAAAGLGGMLTWATYSLFNNLSRITGTFVSQAHGRDDDRQRRPLRLAGGLHRPVHRRRSCRPWAISATSSCPGPATRSTSRN